MFIKFEITRFSLICEKDRHLSGSKFYRDFASLQRIVLIRVFGKIETLLAEMNKYEPWQSCSKYPTSVAQFAANCLQFFSTLLIHYFN